MDIQLKKKIFWDLTFSFVPYCFETKRYFLHQQIHICIRFGEFQYSYVDYLYSIS